MNIVSVPGYPGYSVSSDGEVFGKLVGKLKPHIPRSKLARVALCDKERKWQVAVRDIVALAFHGQRPDYHIVHHIDRDITNVKASNLIYFDLHKMCDGWKLIPGFSNYRINAVGVVQSCKRSLNYVDWFDLKLRYDKQGYAVVSLTSDEGVLWQPLVHRLVLLSFVGACPDGMETRHLNGIKHDNRLENLQYGTPIENAADKEIHGTVARGDKLPSRARTLALAKLHGETIRLTYKKGKHGCSVAALSRKYKIRLDSIKSIIEGKL